MNSNESAEPSDFPSHGLPIFKMSTRQYMPWNKKETKMTSKETDWEQVAHELAYSIMCLEDDCDTPKVWRKAFRALQRYEEACLAE